MPTDVEITALPTARADEAAEMFARAFFENPAWVWTLPEPSRRARVLRFFYGAAIRYAFRHGDLLATAGAVRGATIVLPPDRPYLDGRGLARVGLWQLPFRAGPRAFERFHAQGRGFAERQRVDVAPRHAYLWEIGVEPEHQGRGIGSAVLRAVTARSDAAGAPTYLDTTDARNLSLYARQGFRVVHHAVFPHGGCPYWTLVRPPAGRPS